ncbi:hypothetical protein S7711_04501 [Stachybotrys chartarum IBT 7711]|uniref:PA14 domain-containing protein n=1 Tax=Stachybotrys chartarum (strain CBS 109288 / IBT 7711) TaxID=1280523 RepID=A0A084BA86_STACB|nr:hypothetical protein S7711_04501 [Stachybotrys chartarum IBT 7711]
MKFTVAVFGFGLAIFASAGPCNNNCGRQVIGTSNKNPALPERQALCSQFLTATTTVTPAAATVTAPVVLNRRNVHGPRAPEASATGEKPAYATSCPDVTAYYNACQCFGIVPTTVTVTAAAATETLPAATCTQGLEFAIYAVPADSLRASNLQRAYDIDQLSIDFDLQFGGVEPDVTGVTPYAGFQQSQNWQSPISIYGKAGPAGTAMGRSIINHRGYLVPSTLGSYTVYLDSADDALYAWVGDNALSNWFPNNSQANRFFPTGGVYAFSFQVTEINKPIPLRFVWVNEGGPGAFQFRLIDPTGKLLLGPATPKGPQIIASCSGNDLPVPAWPSWEQER